MKNQEIIGRTSTKIWKIKKVLNSLTLSPLFLICTFYIFMQILFRVGHSLTLQTEKLLTVTQCFIINIILIIIIVLSCKSVHADKI